MNPALTNGATPAYMFDDAVMMSDDGYIISQDLRPGAPSTTKIRPLERTLTQPDNTGTTHATEGECGRPTSS